MDWTNILAYGSMVLLIFVGLLLMVVILLQRGRGGGLAGAFGGAGGQSAFGTRAGDVFTKITAGLAILWVFLAGVSRFALEPASNRYAASYATEQQLIDQANAKKAELDKERKDKEEADKKVSDKKESDLGGNTPDPNTPDPNTPDPNTPDPNTPDPNDSPDKKPEGGNAEDKKAGE